MLRMSLIATAALWSASAACAAPFSPAHVSAEARWVLHYDVDASRETAYGKKFHEEHVATEEGRRKLDWVRDRYGIDLEKDLHGFTAYGTSYEPHSGVLLIHSKFDPAKVEAVIRDEADYRTSRHGDRVIHLWTAKHRRPDSAQETTREHPLAAAFVQNHTVVIAAGEDQVKQALDVLDGEAASLRGKQSLLVFDVPAGTFFQGAAIGLTDLKAQRRPFPVLQESNSARLTFGEHVGRTSFSFRLDAGPPQRAEQVATMAEGFRAMLQLHAEARPLLLPIAEGFRLERSDSTITVNWTVATEAVLKLGEQAKAERDARRNRQ